MGWGKRTCATPSAATVMSEEDEEEADESESLAASPSSRSRFDVTRLVGGTGHREGKSESEPYTNSQVTYNE